jgi:hypothetical protein
VVSISALDALQEAHPDLYASYSRYSSLPGEIALRGIHPFEVEEITNAQTGDSEVWPRQGTSFAAPRFSVWAALHLLTGGISPCEEGDGIVPFLGYKTDRFTVNNLLLNDAAVNFCIEFYDKQGMWAALNIAEFDADWLGVISSWP